MSAVSVHFPGMACLAKANGRHNSGTNSLSLWKLYDDFVMIYPSRFPAVSAKEGLSVHWKFVPVRAREKYKGKTSIEDNNHDLNMDPETVLTTALQRGFVTSMDSRVVRGVLVRSFCVPSSVETIDSECFRGEKQMEQLVFCDNCRIVHIGAGAFAQSSLESVSFPPSLEVIGECSFCGCENLGRVTFSSGSKLTNIGSKAFSGCSFTNCDIPDSVERVGDYCFAENRALSNVTIGQGVVHIGCGAFAHTAVGRIRIPSSVEVVGEDCFLSCMSLGRACFGIDSRLIYIGPGAFQRTRIDKVKLPKQIREVSVHSFSPCSALREVDFSHAYRLTKLGRLSLNETSIRSITVPMTVEIIDSQCFDGCKTLESVTFADNSRLVYIGSCAFQHTKLQSIVFPQSVEFIGDNCFAASLLSSINFHERARLVHIGSHAFQNIQAKFIEVPVSVEYVGESCFSSNHLLTVLFAEGSRLTYIGGSAFPRNINLFIYGIPSRFEVRIPSSVEVIGDSLFQGCSPRVSFEAGSHAVHIGKETFSMCNIDKIEIPPTVETLGDYCFKNCSGTIHLDRTSQIRFIGNNAFQGASLNEVFLPSRLESLGCGCFLRCASLSCVTFAEGILLTSIGASVFQSCPIRKIMIPAKTEVIEANCFRYCECLCEIEFAQDSRLSSIGPHAFEGVSVKTITIPPTVEIIGEKCFYLVHTLEVVEFADSSRLVFIGEGAYQGTSVHTIMIPFGVEVIADSCFRGCQSLKSVQFQEGSHLVDIGSRAFQGSFIHEIAIPSSVETIGERCFFKSGLLSSVQIPEDSHLKNVGLQAFKGTCCLNTVIDRLAALGIYEPCKQDGENIQLDRSDPLNGIVAALTRECGGSVDNKCPIDLTSRTVNIRPENVVESWNESVFTSIIGRNESLCVDFKDRRVAATSYAMRWSSIDCNRHTLTWTFDGSNNGVDWTVLDKRQATRGTYDQFKVQSFDVANCDDSYRMFRVILTGKSPGLPRDRLSISGFEVFGRTLRIEEPNISNIPLNASEPLNGILATLTRLCAGKLSENGIVIARGDGEMEIDWWDDYDYDSWDYDQGNERGLKSRWDPDTAARNAIDLWSDKCFESKNEPDQSLAIEFRSGRVAPTAYTIVMGDNHCKYGAAYLRSWVIEVSNNGKCWIEIDRHEESDKLTYDLALATFEISNCTEAYQMIRLRQIGPNQLGEMREQKNDSRYVPEWAEPLISQAHGPGRHRLVIRAFEVFGRLEGIEDIKRSIKEHHSFWTAKKRPGARKRNTANNSIDPLAGRGGISATACPPEERVMPLAENEELISLCNNPLNGIIARLGQQVNGNPCDNGLVKVTGNACQAPRMAIDYSVETYYASKGEANEWLCVDFKDRTVIPSAYSLRSSVVDPLTSWVFEASSDGLKWKELDRRKDTAALTEHGAIGSWELGPCNEKYRMFRIRRIDRQDEDHKMYREKRLMFSGFEVFGRTECIEEPKYELVPLKPESPMNGIIQRLIQVSAYPVEDSPVEFARGSESHSTGSYGWTVSYSDSSRGTLTFNFKDRQIIPTGYTLRREQYPGWILYASNDGVNWTELHRCQDIGCLNALPQVASFPILYHEKAYRMFQIIKICGRYEDVEEQPMLRTTGFSPIETSHDRDFEIFGWIQPLRPTRRPAAASRATRTMSRGTPRPLTFSRFGSIW